jgi:hypothetical protein
MRPGSSAAPRGDGVIVDSGVRYAIANGSRTRVGTSIATPVYSLILAVKATL